MFLISFLGACGPKTVGDDIEPSSLSGGVSGAHDISELRYPYSGSRVDKRLFHLNSPEFMHIQQSTVDQHLKEEFDNKDAPNDYTNLQPKQVSPFRQ